MPITKDQVYRNTVTNKQFRVTNVDAVAVFLTQVDDAKKKILMPLPTMEASVKTGRLVEV